MIRSAGLNVIRLFRSTLQFDNELSESNLCYDLLFRLSGSIPIRLSDSTHWLYLTRDLVRLQFRSGQEFGSRWNEVAHSGCVLAHPGSLECAAETPKRIIHFIMCHR